MEASLGEDWTDQVKTCPKFLMAIIKMQRNMWKQGNVQLKFHQIKRLDRSNTRFDCTNTTGALDFEVDRKVWLHGIGLFGAESG